ncbi:MAG: hypothetical protein M3Z75_08775 [Actinomycetota bacterium]|nr:hypothetical protein [Actinomycetota bacterium]
MSEFEQDPSANTGRFRAFVERGDEDAPRRARRSSVSPVVLIIIGVVVIAVVLAIVGLA